jgi:hypothetical protein
VTGSLTWTNTVGVVRVVSLTADSGGRRIGEDHVRPQSEQFFGELADGARARGPARCRRSGRIARRNAASRAVVTTSGVSRSELRINEGREINETADPVRLHRQY